MRLKEIWGDEWSRIEFNKLRQIKDGIGVCKAGTNDRKSCIITTRLRIGHTRMTHQYLKERTEQPYCEDCLVLLTVKHVLAECPSHSDTRELRYPGTREMSVEEALRGILAEKSDGRFDYEGLMNYLLTLGIYHEIV